VLSGKSIKLKKLNPLLQQLQLLSKKIVLVKKMRMTRTKRLLQKALRPLGNHLKNIRKQRRINADVVTMILANLSNTIQHILNF
jgi:hypothetical protein